MKTLLLAGGFGTRLSEETHTVPKPMVEIGGKPILWHIMKQYSHHGFNEFVILLGYKSNVIKDFFINYFLYQNDVEIDLKTNEVKILNNNAEDWKVTLLDTGLHTMTGGRLKRAKEVIGDNPFMFTYGDGVSNIDIKGLNNFHQSHGKLCTMTSVQPEGRYGAMTIDDNNCVTSFKEKPKDDGGFINAGFFVCQPEVLDFIEGDYQMFENDPLEAIAKKGELMTYKHSGFWHAMDTLRDKRKLNNLWDEGITPWKVWE